MRWFRSQRTSVAWLACFALACQLVLSFGHVHVGKASSSSGLWSALTGHAATVTTPDQSSDKKPIGLADDYCAICSNANLANTLLIPLAPAIIIAFHVTKNLPWSVAETEPVRFEHPPSLARGPPRA
jgi:hypothetical protein